MSNFFEIGWDTAEQVEPGASLYNRIAAGDYVSTSDDSSRLTFRQVVGLNSAGHGFGRVRFADDTEVPAGDIRRVIKCGIGAEVTVPGITASRSGAPLAGCIESWEQRLAHRRNVVFPGLEMLPESVHLSDMECKRIKVSAPAPAPPPMPEIAVGDLIRFVGGSGLYRVTSAPADRRPQSMLSVVAVGPKSSYSAGTRVSLDAVILSSAVGVDRKVVPLTGSGAGVVKDRRPSVNSPDGIWHIVHMDDGRVSEYAPSELRAAP